MRKILIICGGLQFGGVERFAANIIRFAPKDEFSFDYLVFEGLGYAFAPEVESEGGRIITLPNPSKGYISYIRNLNHLIRENHYDVIHSQTQFNSGINLWVANRNKIPVRISHSHTTAHEKKISVVKATYELLMRRLILRYSTCRCSCGTDAGKWMYGDNAFIIINNGIDSDSFRYSHENRKKIRTAYGLSDDAFVIGHSGVLSKLKNQEYLIRMLKRLLNEKPTAILMLLGRDSDGFYNRLTDIASKCGVRDRVIFTGSVFNVNEYLAAFDVFAFPSLREGTPIALIEAQANGLPCVISDRIPEDVVLTNLVKRIPLEDSAAWKQSILESVRRNSEKYAEMVEKRGYGIYSAMEPLYQIYRGE